MTRCCPADVIVFGHTMCRRRPAWAVSEAAADWHDIGDYHQRCQWSMQADAELRKSRKRGAVRPQNAPGHAGIPRSWRCGDGTGRRPVSADPTPCGICNGTALVWTARDREARFTPDALERWLRYLEWLATWPGCRCDPSSTESGPDL